MISYVHLHYFRMQLCHFSNVLVNYSLVKRIARLHSHVCDCVAARCGSSRYRQFDPCSPESPIAQWLVHLTRSRRIVASNPIWDSDFSECTFLSEFTLNIMLLLLFLRYYSQRAFFFSFSSLFSSSNPFFLCVHLYYLADLQLFSFNADAKLAAWLR